MIRKYHNHKPQTTNWHREEERLNHHETPGRQISSLSQRGEEGLNTFYWYQIFALDSAVVEAQEIFSSHGGHLTNAMYHNGETF